MGMAACLDGPVAQENQCQKGNPTSHGIAGAQDDLC